MHMGVVMVVIKSNIWVMQPLPVLGRVIHVMLMTISRIEIIRVVLVSKMELRILGIVVRFVRRFHELVEVHKI